VDVFQRTAYIAVCLWRIECQERGVLLLVALRMPEESGFTLPFDGRIIARIRDMRLLTYASQMQEINRQMFRVNRRHVRKSRESLDISEARIDRREALRKRTTLRRPNALIPGLSRMNRNTEGRRGAGIIDGKAV